MHGYRITKKRNWQETSAGLLQATKRSVRTYALMPSSKKSKYNDGVLSSLGSMQIRMPTPNYSFLKIKMNLVPAAVTLLLDLEVYKNRRLVANNVLNELQATHHGWPRPLTREHEQHYLT